MSPTRIRCSRFIRHDRQIIEGGYQYFRNSWKRTLRPTLVTSPTACEIIVIVVIRQQPILICRLERPPS